MSIKSTLNSLLTETPVETQIRETLYENYKDEKPSRRVITNIMNFASSYDCKATKIGKVEMMLN